MNYRPLSHKICLTLHLKQLLLCPIRGNATLWFIITQQDIFHNMEGNSNQFRPSSWKYSMIKHNTAQSRILTDNKDVLSKFSPARNADQAGNNTSKSLVRSKIMSRSHDEIALRDLKESSVSKDKNIQKRLTAQTQGQMGSIQKPLQSEESLNMKFQSPVKPKQSKRNSFAFQNSDFIKDIKIEYLRFKQRVLNQLKKQQETITKAIQQIMMIVRKSSNTNFNTTTIQEKILPNTSKISTFDDPVYFSKSLPKLSIPSHITVDTAKYRESLVTDKIEIESVMPKIKQRMNKMFDLMGLLKDQISEQSFHPLSAAKSNTEQEE